MKKIILFLLAGCYPVDSVTQCPAPDGEWEIRYSEQLGNCPAHYFRETVEWNGKYDTVKLIPEDCQGYRLYSKDYCHLTSNLTCYNGKTATWVSSKIQFVYDDVLEGQAEFTVSFEDGSACRSIYHVRGEKQ